MHRPGRLVEFAAGAARAGGTAARRRIPAEQRLAARPVGKQMPLDTFPMSTALSPDGKYLLVLNGGYRPPSHQRARYGHGQLVSSSVPVADGWLGLAFSPEGDRVYVGGGSRAAVFEFTLRRWRAHAGPHLPRDRRRQARAEHDFIGDVAFSPDGRLIYAADLYHDSVVVINPQSGMVIDRFKTGRRPYRILFHPDGKSFFVTSWADGIARPLRHRHRQRNWRTCRLGPHPTDMVWRAGGAGDGGPGEPHMGRAAVRRRRQHQQRLHRGRQRRQGPAAWWRRINIAMTPRQPLGMTPTALALSPDGKRLYVACSDANVAAVVDVSGARSHVEGFIPTGWYPTAVRVLPSGTLVVLNGKGLRSYPNPNGPNPAQAGRAGARGRPASRSTWAACRPARHRGSSRFTDEQLAAWTKTGARQSRPIATTSWMTPSTFPPIQHVIYIVKENRTYDQVLGDMKEGNGDASLVLFGENVTPNQHKLAREFVLLDNFYVNADVSADGHNWSTAAIAPDYVQKMWPNELRRPPQDLRLRRAGPGVAAARRLPLDRRRRGRPLHAQLRLHGEEQDATPRRARSRSTASATRCWPRSPTASIAASIWTIPTWSAPRSSSPNWRNMRRPATCRG